MTKYLDTYEIWDKVFKLTKNHNEQYKIYIHDNCWLSPKMSMITLDKKELSGLINFLRGFMDDE